MKALARVGLILTVAILSEGALAAICTCGKTVRDDAAFCPKCGVSIPAPAPAPAPAPVPPPTPQPEVPVSDTCSDSVIFSLGFVSPQIGLSLPYPKSGASRVALKGISFGVFGSGYGDVYGINLASFATWNDKGDMDGFSISSLLNFSEGLVNGGQIALINGTKKGVNGFQIGLCNMGCNEFGYMNGFQIAGFLNVANGDVNGVQCGVLNVCVRSVNGCQVGGIVNYAERDLNGCQIGVFNQGQGNVRGFQIGVYNGAGELSGVQIGLINYNKRGKVHFIPVINAGW